MRITLIVHIVAGSLGLISGFIALYSAKGAALHKKAGIVFVCTMLTMSTAGLSIALIRGVAPMINVPAALVTASLVVTALTTMRPPSLAARWLDLAAMMTLLAVGLTNLTFALQAFANGGQRNGIPAFPFILFGLAGTIAGVGDLRMLRSGPLHGARRIARHLWRMSFALFIAALSFFIGQAKVIPEPIRIMPLLALPVLMVLVTMFYWLWRVRIRKSLRGLTRTNAMEMT
jgi:uncharacterized membrane protein